MLGAAIKAFFDCLTAAFKMSETKTEHGAEVYALKDAQKLQKASDISEEVIELAVKYKRYMTEFDQRRLVRLIRRFRKYN